MKQYTVKKRNEVLERFEPRTEVSGSRAAVDFREP
jgi:hypothetical protein